MEILLCQIRAGSASAVTCRSRYGGATTNADLNRSTSLDKLCKILILRTFKAIQMARSRDVPATEFSRNFTRYREAAIVEKVIHVTSHGRVIGAYLSASEAAHYEQLKRRERQSLVVGELPSDVVSAIEAAEYGIEPR